MRPTTREDYNVYYTTNAEEHQYLDKYLSASVIGTNSLSSIKLTARDAGKGISISTKNISYCTVEMYQNALITAGVSRRGTGRGRPQQYQRHGGSGQRHEGL